MSFDRDRMISERFGTRQNYAVLRLLASLFDAAPGNTTSWLNDPQNFNHVLCSINLVLEALRPSEASDKTAETDEFLAVLNATAAADDILAADASMPPSQADNDFNYIKAAMGPTIADRLRSLEGSGMERGERAKKRSSKL
jgi:hypothetical protein